MEHHSRGGSSAPRSASVSTALSDASEVAVSGSNKGIRAIDLDQVFSSEDARVLALITCFDLSHNEMEVLANLDRMTALRKLNVSYNRIGRVAGLPIAITQLNLSHNCLSQLDGVAQLPHLRELDVSFNRLTSLIGLTTRLPLEVLHADDNRLVSTAGLEDMAQLRVLTLSNNFISNADELVFLSSTPSLQILNVQNNPVSRQTGYRRCVCRLQPAVLSLDGAPLLRDDNTLPETVPRAAELTPKRKPAIATSPARQSASSAPSPASASRARQSAPMTDRHPKSTTTPPNRPLPFHHRGPLLSTASPSSHLVITPSTHASRRRADAYADISLESDAPEAQSVAPQPTELSHNDERHEGSSAVTADNDGRTVSPSSSFVPSGRGSYARQFVVAQQQQLQQAQKPPRPPQEFSVHAPWAQQPARETAAQTSAPRADPIRHATTARAVTHSSSSLMRSAEVQQEDAQLAQLHDSLVARDLLSRENEQLRGAMKRLEAQLADSRRVVSDQLADLSKLRLERDALRQSEEELKARCERAKRTNKMQEAHHRDELLTLQAQYDRVKAFYEAELADVRRQLAEELRRPRAHQLPRAEQTSSCSEALPIAPPLHTTQPLPSVPKITSGATGGDAEKPAGGSPPTPASTTTDPCAWQEAGADGGGEFNAARSHKPPATRSVHFTTHHTTAGARLSRPVPLRAFSLLSPQGSRRTSSQDGLSPVSQSSPAPDVLANQLKGWLYTEMATDAGKAEEEAILARLRASVEAQDAGAASTSRSSPRSSDARVLLEGFVARQLSATAQQNAAVSSLAAKEDVTDAGSNATASHALHVVEVQADGAQREQEEREAGPVLGGSTEPNPVAAADSPNVRQQQQQSALLGRPITGGDTTPRGDANNTSPVAESHNTPSPLPPPAAPAVVPSQVDSAYAHEQALWTAESILGLAASRLDVKPHSAGQAPLWREDPGEL